jgi:hypothetical protein
MKLACLLSPYSSIRCACVMLTPVTMVVMIAVGHKENSVSIVCSNCNIVPCIVARVHVDKTNNPCEARQH